LFWVSMKLGLLIKGNMNFVMILISFNLRCLEYNFRYLKEVTAIDKMII